jgi:hypothetical protein
MLAPIQIAKTEIMIRIIKKNGRLTLASCLPHLGDRR